MLASVLIQINFDRNRVENHSKIVIERHSTGRWTFEHEREAIEKCVEESNRSVNRTVNSQEKQKQKQKVTNNPGEQK